MKPVDPEVFCKEKGKTVEKGRNEFAILIIISGGELPLFKERQK